ncbi:Transaldolase [Propionicimonas sp. T2.31MG-18]
MNQRLADLSAAGVSIWLDDLSRGRIASGNLAGMIRDNAVVGVTTNPTIFAAALAHGADYAAQLEELGQVTVAEAITALTTTDVRDSCDLFAPTYARTGGFDGRVSIEVEPGVAHDTAATTTQAAELHRIVDRENVLIKIPATQAGLAAIEETIAAGISVNVTLIFSVERYRAVMDAYLAGLERAADAGRDLSRIHSVASFFISRVDTEVDRRLDALGRADRGGARRSRTRRWRSPRTRRCSPGIGSRPSPPAARTCSDRCGRPPGRRTRLTPTRSTWPGWSPGEW